MIPTMLLLALPGCEDEPVPEDCANGVDDDQDGLLDCEDADCALICVERVCDDGQDDDYDGLVDCEDDDCWGGACPSVRARVHGGEADMAWQQDLLVISGMSSGFHSYSSIEGTLVGRSLWGTVAWSGTTCTWELDRVELGAAFRDDEVLSHTLDRQGLVLDPSCPRDELELPPLLVPAPGGADLSVGLPWYAGQSLTSTSTSTYGGDDGGSIWASTWRAWTRKGQREVELQPAAAWVGCSEGEAMPFWPDLDGDGAGDASATPFLACGPGPYMAADALDCDDSDPAVPGEEICGNGIDDDCDGGQAPCAVAGHLDGSGATWLEDLDSRLAVLEGSDAGRLMLRREYETVLQEVGPQGARDVAWTTELGTNWGWPADDVDGDGQEDLLLQSHDWGLALFSGGLTGSITLDQAMSVADLGVDSGTLQSLDRSHVDDDGVVDLAFVGLFGEANPQHEVYLLSGAALLQGHGLEGAQAHVAPGTERDVYPTAALVDRDGDGVDELAFSTVMSTAEARRSSEVRLLDAPAGTYLPEDGLVLSADSCSIYDVIPGRDLTAADLDGDGYQELVFGGERRELCVLGPDQAGLDGCEGASARIQAMHRIYRVANLGDLDGDGADELGLSGSRGLDVVSRPQGVTLEEDDFLARVDATELAYTYNDKPSVGVWATAGDLDGDGHRDLAVVLAGEDQATWVFWGGEGW